MMIKACRLVLGEKGTVRKKEREREPECLKRVEGGAGSILGHPQGL